MSTQKKKKLYAWRLLSLQNTIVTYIVINSYSKLVH